MIQLHNNSKASQHVEGIRNLHHLTSTEVPQKYCKSTEVRFDGKITGGLVGNAACSLFTWESNHETFVTDGYHEDPPDHFQLILQLGHWDPQPSWASWSWSSPKASMLQDVYCHTRGSKIYTMTLEATVYQDEVQKWHKLLKILKGSTKDLGAEKLPLVQFGCQNWPTWIEKRPHALLTLQITCRGKTPKTCLGSNHEKTGKTQLWWSIDSFAFRSSKTAPVNARHRLLCMDSIQLRLLLGVESVEGLYRPYIFPKCPTSRLLWCLCTHSNLCIRPLEILVPDFCMNPFRTDVSGLSPVKLPQIEIPYFSGLSELCHHSLDIQ